MLCVCVVCYLSMCRNQTSNQIFNTYFCFFSRKTSKEVMENSSMGSLEREREREEGGGGEDNSYYSVFVVNVGQFLPLFLGLMEENWRFLQPK